MQGVRLWKFLSYSHLAWDNHGVFHKSQSEFCANYGTDGKYGRTYTQFLMRFVVSNGTTPFLHQFLLRFAKTRVAPSPPYSTLICCKTCDLVATGGFSDMVQSWHRIYESGEQRPISGRYYPLQPLPHHGLCLPSFLSSIWGCEIATEPMCKMVFQWCETGIAPPTQPKVLSCGSPVDVVHLRHLW